MIDPNWWLLPREAYKRREEIKSAWDRLITLFQGRRSRIAFTGTAGTGKTVLFDHLALRASLGYHPPQRSEKKESGKLVKAGQRIAVSVVPGQHSAPRHEAVDDLFGGKHSVDGVVHVTCFGYVDLRERVAKDTIISQGLTSIPLYREQMMKDELTDLEHTCEDIRRSIRRNGRPKWMIVAVTKADLFSNNLEEAEQYYSPHGKGPFVDRLNLLQRQVGTDRFRWTALPVCSWLEDFIWNGETQKTNISVAQRDHLLATLVETMGNYCE